MPRYIRVKLERNWSIRGEAIDGKASEIRLEWFKAVSAPNLGRMVPMFKARVSKPASAPVSSSAMASTQKSAPESSPQPQLVDLVNGRPVELVSIGEALRRFGYTLGEIPHHPSLNHYIERDVIGWSSHKNHNYMSDGGRLINHCGGAGKILLGFLVVHTGNNTQNDKYYYYGQMKYYLIVKESGLELILGT